MKETYRPKEVVLERLQTLIEEEENLLTTLLDDYVGEQVRALNELRRRVLAGETYHGAHLKALRELYKRFKDDTRENLPLDHAEYTIIIDGKGGGHERMARMVAANRANKLNAMLQRMGLSTLPRELTDAVIARIVDEECDDPNCPIHGGGNQALRETTPEETDNIADRIDPDAGDDPADVSEDPDEPETVTGFSEEVGASANS